METGESVQRVYGFYLQYSYNVSVSLKLCQIKLLTPKKKKKHGPNEPIYKAETDSHRDQTVIGKGEWGEWTGSAGLADANCQAG